MSFFAQMEMQAATARAGEEAELLSVLADLSLPGEAARARLHHLVLADAFTKAAMLLQTRALAGHGFYVGQGPGGRGLACQWRRGDQRSRPFEAATPALALLRAIASELAQAQERDLRTACAACGGLGWIILEDGGKRVCRHTLCTDQ